MFRQARNTITKAVTTGIVVFGTVELVTNLPSQGRSSLWYHTVADDIVTPLLRQILNPEGTFDLLRLFGQHDSIECID